MPTYEFRANCSALIVVDMQNAFLDSRYASYVPDAQAVVEPINELADTCRQAGMPIIWTTHVLQPDLSNRGLIPLPIAKALVADGRGIHFYPKMHIRPEDKVIRKPRFSAFWETDLYEYLTALNRDTLVVTGCVLNVCCESTARDAFQHDIKVFFPKELNKTRDHQDQGFGPYTAEEMTAHVLTSLGSKFVHLIGTDEMFDLVKRPASSSVGPA